MHATAVVLRLFGYNMCDTRYTCAGMIEDERNRKDRIHVCLLLVLDCLRLFAMPCVASYG